MPTEGGGAAAHDSTHLLQLAKAEMDTAGTTPSGTMVAEEIRVLQGKVGYCGRLPWRARPQLQQREMIKWARHIARHSAWDVRITGRRIQRRMFEQH